MKKVELRVNGTRRQFVVPREKALLDLLRDDLDLTGAKQSCDRKGQCGACMVIVNGRAVRSCLTKVADLDGAEVITVEGLGSPDNPHLIQEAFVLAGAVQCGYCTPGMIMGAKALLDENNNPSDEEIKSALRRNLCRCTGYKTIIDAVRLAGRFLRGETTPDEIRPDPAGNLIGSSQVRPTAYIRACGEAKFTADYKVHGALELSAVRSPHTHARIVSIDTSEAEKMPGVVGAMTARDIKGTNRLKYLVDDQPVLCEDRVRLLGDAVALVVAKTKAEADAAAAAVKVTYEELPAVSTIKEALKEGAPRVHENSDNLCFTAPLKKGDAEGALGGSAAVVELDASTQMIHQAPLEPEATVAYMEGEGDDARLVVIGRSINIHHHRMLLQEALGWEDIRYEEPYVGGQFGIKLDITSEALAAAAALHFRQPIRYVCSLTESMWITTKRHPMEARLRLGADDAGKLTGLDVEYALENGAYTSWGKGVVLRMLQMLSGAYNIPHVKAFGKLVPYKHDGPGGQGAPDWVQAVDMALAGAWRHAAPRPQGAMRLLVADNPEPRAFGALLDMLDLKKTAFNVISKSGTTAETMSQYLVVLEKLEKELGEDEARRRMVFTTDPEKGNLRLIAGRNPVSILNVPPNVGGRYSVLSAVGLLPLACAGHDVGALHGRGGGHGPALRCAGLEGQPGLRLRLPGRGVHAPEPQHPGDDALHGRPVRPGPVVRPALGRESGQGQEPGGRNGEPGPDPGGRGGPHRPAQPAPALHGRPPGQAGGADHARGLQAHHLPARALCGHRLPGLPGRENPVQAGQRRVPGHGRGPGPGRAAQHDHPDPGVERLLPGRPAPDAGDGHRVRRRPDGRRSPGPARGGTGQAAHLRPHGPARVPGPGGHRGKHGHPGALPGMSRVTAMNACPRRATRRRPR